MQPPIPQLSGTSLISPSAKRARAASVLSFVGAALLFAMPVLLVLLFVWGGRDSSTVPLAGHEITMDLIAAPFVLGSVGCSLAGLLMGVTMRKNGAAKAFYVGGATLLVWLLIAGAIGASMVRQANNHQLKRAVR